MKYESKSFATVCLGVYLGRGGSELNTASEIETENVFERKCENLFGQKSTLTQNSRDKHESSRKPPPPFGSAIYGFRAGARLNSYYQKSTSCASVLQLGQLKGQKPIVC